MTDSSRTTSSSTPGFLGKPPRRGFIFLVSFFLPPYDRLYTSQNSYYVYIVLVSWTFAGQFAPNFPNTFFFACHLVMVNTKRVSDVHGGFKFRACLKPPSLFFFFKFINFSNLSPIYEIFKFTAKRMMANTKKTLVFFL